MGKRKERVIYMAVDNSIYELPLDVFDTVDEMAKKYGVEKCTVYGQVAKGRRGERAKYIEVVLDDEEYKEIDEMQNEGKKKDDPKPIPTLHVFRQFFQSDENQLELVFDSHFEAKRKQKAFIAEKGRHKDVTVTSRIYGNKLILTKQENEKEKEKEN